MKVNNIDLRLKLEKFFKEQLWINALVLICISTFAWLFNKPFETLFFCVAHLVLRPCFEKQYHCGKTYACIFTTLTIAVLGIYTCLPMAVSLLSSLPIACFVCWVGYIFQDRVDLLIYKHNNECFTLETATKEEIIKLCSLLHYKKDKIELAIKFFVDKLSNIQVLEWLCDNHLNVEYDTVIKYRYRMTKDFKKFEHK